MIRPHDEADVFRRLTAEIDLTVPTVTDLPVVWRDGVPYRLNAFEGDDLRRELSEAYAMTVADLEDLGLTRPMHEAEIGDLVGDSLEKVLYAQRTGLELGDMVAVQGSVAFDVPDIARDDSTPRLLGRPDILFGELAGIGYGTFTYAGSEDVAEFLQGKEMILPVEYLPGPMLYLGEAALCNTTEVFGPENEAFPIALLPIAINYRLYKAHPAK